MTTEEKVIHLIKENSNTTANIYGKSNIKFDLSIDSFDRLMIVNAIEDEFGIEVKESEIDNFQTVDDIVKALDENYL